MYIYSDYLGNAIRFPVFNMRDDLILYFNDVNIPCISEVVISLANEENLDILDIQNTVRINCNQASLGPTQKIIRLHSLNLFEFEDRNLGGSGELKDALLDSTTTMMFNYMLSGNKYVKNMDEILMIIDLSNNLKNMANAAFFTVSKVVIDFGINYLKQRAEQVSGNATYALSAIVKETSKMSLDLEQGEIKRILEEPSQVKELSDDEEGEQDQLFSNFIPSSGEDPDSSS